MTPPTTVEAWTKMSSAPNARERMNPKPLLRVVANDDAVIHPCAPRCDRRAGGPLRRAAGPDTFAVAHALPGYREHVPCRAPIPRLSPTALDRAVSKAYRRLLPLLFLCYIIAYVDRNNVSIAFDTMKQDLNHSWSAAHPGETVLDKAGQPFPAPRALEQRRAGHRVRDLLPRLLPAGDPRHTFGRAVEREQVDQPDHDLVGDHGGAHLVRPHARPVLPLPVFARVWPRRGSSPA